MAHTIRLSLPCILSYVLSFANRFVVTLVVGHLGAKELAASTLAVMFTNVLGFSICFGVTSALDTLASQAVTGAANPRQAGVFLQRAILINLLFAIPLAIVWLFAEPLLVLAHQEPELAKLAGNYIKIMLAALVPNIISNCVTKFLIAQGYTSSQFVVSATVFPFNVALQYALVYYPSRFQLGFYGAAVGSVVADTVSMLGIIAYTVYWNGHQCWKPWSREALSGWRQFLKLGLPGLVMVCSEWWLFEVVALVAGSLGSETLAAQSILLNSCSLLYMVFLGISVANSSRVGNLLGAGKAVRAKFSAQVSLIMSFCVAIMISTGLMVFRHDWGRIFNNNENVIKLVASVLPVCALFQFADGGVCVVGGILRGCGKQKIGALLNLVSYYLIGLPAALLFTFTFDLGLLGIWLGLAGTQIMCYGVQVLYVLYAVDWDLEVRYAQDRVNETDRQMLLDRATDFVEDDDPEYGR
ncbi:ethionine resistance protein [Blastocladiella emersonii ATCC 22665]|nr:ethionine resistance protein [Blastocladiella emersonii ATCC 22665]